MNCYAAIQLQLYDWIVHPSKEITPAHYLGILSLPCEYLITVLSQLDL